MKALINTAVLAINNSFSAAVAWVMVGFIESLSSELTQALAPWHYGLAGYLTLECVLDGVIEPWYEARLKQKHNKLSLATQGSGDLPSRFAHFIECHVMNRYSFFGYKNNVQSNLRVFSALMLTVFSVFAVLTTAHFIEFVGLWPGYVGKELPVSFWVGTLVYFVGSFALEKWSHVDKWKHLAERFQSMMEREPGMRRDVLECLFVCDLIATNMWSHDSYQEVFEKNMVKAMSMHWGEYPFKTTDLKFTRQDLLSRPIPKQMALRAMQDRLERLLHAEQLDAIQNKRVA